MPRLPRVLSLLPLVALAALLPAQQRPLTHDDYDQWKSIRGNAYSQDGKWVAYQIEPQFGDGVLIVRQTEGDVVHEYPLASGARFSSDGRFVAFTVGKSKVEERKKKIDELRKKQAEKEKKEGEKGEKKEGEETPATPPGTTPPTTPEPAAGGARGAAPGGMPFGGRGGRGGRGGPGAPGAPGAGGADETSRERGELCVVELATGKLDKIGKVKGFTLPDEAAFLVYHLDKPEPKKDEAKPEDKKPAEGEKKPEGEKPAGEPKAGEPTAAEPKPAEPKAGEPTGEPPAEGARGGRRGGRRGQGGQGGQAAPGARPTTPEDPMEKKRQEGTVLVVRNLANGEERRFEDVVGYGLTRKATWLWFHTSAKKPAKDHTYGLFAQKLAGGDLRPLVEGFADFGGFTTDKEETGLAFTCKKDDFAAEKPRSDVWLWNLDDKPATCIVHPGTPGLPAGKRTGSGLGFSRDGRVLTFSISDPPEPEPLPILPEEKVSLDLWHWNDGQLQSQQQKRGGRRNDNLTAVWHRGQGQLRVLGDEVVEQVRLFSPDGRYGLGSDDQPYEKLTTWDGRYNDVWLVDTTTGQRTKVLQKLRGSTSTSPDGRWLLWFSPDYHWWAMEVATQQLRDLTGKLPVPFHRTDDDHPEPDPAWGIAGFTEHDKEVVLNDEFDLWRVDLATGNAVCITDGFGRATHQRLRVQVLDREQEFLPERLVLAADDTETMAQGFYTASLQTPGRPQRLTMIDKAYGELVKPKHADRFFFTISTWSEFPDLWTANADFSGQKRLSQANPQQANYTWGKAELVHWINGDGKRLAGVLVKPDGFDPKKKYPLLVSFYERSSQSLHGYVAPQPGTSPNAAYYVSNGYLWFMPDIVYEVGYPGESCVKCVVSGVQALIAQGFVDEKGIGACGHSWGGYQTAFLVTRTNIFAAVECGAAVSNMISAYGGIRYESGVSRQFQYEQTQSRIGGTPWQYPLRYWENSPIFFADKVRTPVLLLHNDQDGAVPWTNGIEYFTALRRLGKECYLFNYNGEGHGLGKRPNQKDWTRRMAEYFDHHLKGAPAPKWMTEGVPYSERDKEKLPFTPSWVELSAKPATAKPAEATTGPSTGSQDAPQGGEKPKGEPAPKVETPVGKPGGKADPLAMLQPGKPAPDFSAPDETGTTRKLGDFAGKYLVIWFYPKASTPG